MRSLGGERYVIEEGEEPVTLQEVHGWWTLGGEGLGRRLGNSSLLAVLADVSGVERPLALRRLGRGERFALPQGWTPDQLPEGASLTVRALELVEEPVRDGAD